MSDACHKLLPIAPDFVDKKITLCSRERTLPEFPFPC